jgi:hypothetical protein
MKPTTVAPAGAAGELEVHKRFPRADHVSLIGVKFQNLSRERTGYFYDGFGRLNGHHRLIDFDGVAFLDMPRDDFRLGQAFAQVGEVEGGHGATPSQRKAGG